MWNTSEYSLQQWTFRCYISSNIIIKKQIYINIYICLKSHLIFHLTFWLGPIFIYIWYIEFDIDCNSNLILIIIHYLCSALCKSYWLYIEITFTSKRVINENSVSRMRENFTICLKSMAVSLHYCRVAFDKIKALFVGLCSCYVLPIKRYENSYLDPTQISLNFGQLVASDSPCWSR